MKLNLAKCNFKVDAGNFLHFMISRRGIEANPEKVQALQNMEAIKKQKDIQKLPKRIAALNRFVSKLERIVFPSSMTLRK